MRMSPAAVARLGLVLALVAASAAHAAYDPTDPAQKAEYDHALDVGSQAYDYGVPLMSMDRVYRGSISVNVPDGRGAGPVNEFSTFRKLADAKDRYAVGPNNDTLYSDAWLDMSRGPVVVHLDPSPKRFRYLEFLSPYEENFANVGSSAKALKGTDFLVTPPGWNGHVPAGDRRIRSPYDRAWVVGRTFVRDSSDLAGAKKVARTFRITPRPRPPKHKDTTVEHATTPGTQPGEDPLTFFDALNVQLARFRPPAADQPILDTIKELGIGPGLSKVSTSTTLSDAQKAGLAAAVTGAEDRLKARFANLLLSGFDKHNGWLVFTAGGHYGTDYATRALIDRFGFGSPTPDIAIYPLAATDRNRAPLTGAKRYVVHFDAKDAHPPARDFWSLTIYGTDLFFVPNPINRYLLNDRSNLVRNADGSLDIYVQPDAPASAQQKRNWLPSPQPDAADPGFRLIVRLYGLSDPVLKGIEDGSGWEPPTILPCGDDGKTSAGVACAT